MLRGTPFRLDEKHRIFTWFYIEYSNTLLIFTHIHFVDLLSSYPLGRSLESSSEVGATLLGVSKILAMKDLKFPVLFHKSVGVGSFVVEGGPEDGGGYKCELRRSYMLGSEITWQFCAKGQTWMTTFPGVSVTL